MRVPGPVDKLEKRRQREYRECDWHRYFTFRRVQVGMNDWRWLEWVERKRTACNYSESTANKWSYRALGSNNCGVVDDRYSC